MLWAMPPERKSPWQDALDKILAFRRRSVDGKLFISRAEFSELWEAISVFERELDPMVSHGPFDDIGQVEVIAV